MSNSNLKLHLKLNEIVSGQVKDLSGNDNNGTLQGDTAIVNDDTFGTCMSFDGSGDYIELGNPTSLQITDDQTISMWLQPANLNNRQNPYAKAYGGEGTITLEPSGRLNYYYGSSGRNAHTYQGFGTSSSIAINNWTHIAVVRDLTNGKLYWYINGQLDQEATATINPAVAGDLDAYIGKGYTTNYAGKIAGLRIYDKALTGEDILQDLQQDLDAMAAHRQVHPLAFDLANADDEHTLYIKNFGDDQNMYFSICNDADTDIELASLSGEVSDTNYHFQIRFRPGILDAATVSNIALHTDNAGDWELYHQTNTDHSYSLYLKRKATTPIASHMEILVRFTGIQPDASQGTRGGRIGFAFGNAYYTGSPAELLEGTQEEHISIVNQRGSSHIPLTAALISKTIRVNTTTGQVVESGGTEKYCGITVLNDASTQNNLLIALTNVKSANVSHPITLTTDSKITVSFAQDYDDDSAMAGKSNAANVQVYAPNASWVVTPPGGSDVELYWTLQPTSAITLDAGHDNTLLLPLLGLVSDKPDGYTQIYVHYENIPGHRDGQFVLSVLKAPLYIKDSNVGVGTASPLAPLSIGTTAGKESSPDSAMHITNDCLLFGGNNSGKEGNSAQISAGKHVSHSLNIVGMSSGTSSLDRKVDVWAEGGLSIRGNVGIGMDNPQDALQISNFAPGDRYLTITTAGGNRYRAGLKLFVWKQDHGFIIEHDERPNNEGGGNGLNFLSRTVNNAGSITEHSAMFINRSLNVGIGTLDPISKLDVRGDINTRGHIYFYPYEGIDQSGTVYIQARNDDHNTDIEMQFRTQKAGNIVNALRIDKNGNLSGSGIAPYLKKNDLISTHGYVDMQNRHSGNYFNDWTKNYADVSPPSGYSIGNLVGFTASMSFYQFSGDVDGNDKVWCRYQVNYNGSGKVRIIASTSENAQGTSSLRANYLAIWKK